MVEWIIGKYLTRSFQSFYGVIQEEKEKNVCKTSIFYYEPVKRILKSNLNSIDSTKFSKVSGKYCKYVLVK